MKAFIISSLLLLSLFGFAQKNSYTLHKVEKGQTLYGIAKLYSKSIEEIKKINAEVNFNALKYGQQIKIPRFRGLWGREFRFMFVQNIRKKYF